MSSIESEVLNELRELRSRVTKLEQRRHPKHLNQKQAAEYLGRSEEWLRREHAAGRGPNRKRSGTRNWAYSTDDLDAYAAGGEAA